MFRRAGEALPLQIFLDLANSGPKQMDGLVREFSLKALRLYRQLWGTLDRAGEKSSLPISLESIWLANRDVVRLAERRASRCF